MKVHEYQAKALLRKFGVPLLDGEHVTTPLDAVLGGPVDLSRLCGWLFTPVAWVLGGEGAGVSPAFRRRGSFQAAIPMAPGVDSLNVAVAGAILLYARRLAGAGPP